MIDEQSNSLHVINTLLMALHLSSILCSKTQRKVGLRRDEGSKLTALRCERLCFLREILLLNGLSGSRRDNVMDHVMDKGLY